MRTRHRRNRSIIANCFNSLHLQLRVIVHPDGAERLLHTPELLSIVYTIQRDTPVFPEDAISLGIAQLRWPRPFICNAGDDSAFQRQRRMRRNLFARGSAVKCNASSGPPTPPGASRDACCIRESGTPSIPKRTSKPHSATPFKSVRSQLCPCANARHSALQL